MLTERLTEPAARDASDAVSLSFLGAVPETWMRSVAVQAPFAGLAVAVRPVPRTPLTDSLIAPVPVAVPRTCSVIVRPRSFAVADEIASAGLTPAGVTGAAAGAVTV